MFYCSVVYHPYVFSFVTEVADAWEKYGMDHKVLNFMKKKGILVEPREFDTFMDSLPDSMEYKAAVKTEVL